VGTNCPPWDLGELVVHMADSIRLTRRFVDAEARAVVTSAADYYRRVERDTEEYRRKNVDRAQELVGRVPDSVSSTAGMSSSAGRRLL
jgi:hypothetical protein